MAEFWNPADYHAPAPSGTPGVSQQPVLRLGSRGSVVVTLQQRLGALHYHPRPEKVR